MPDKEKILGMMVGLPHKEWLEIRTVVDSLYEKASESVCLTESDVKDAEKYRYGANFGRLSEDFLRAMSDKLEECVKSL